jgi:ABC-2 family transporter protein
MQVLLASPFVTIIFSYFLVSGFIPDPRRPGDDSKTTIISFLFSFFVLTGFSLCTGLFILSPVADRQNNLRQMLNFIGMKPLAYYTGSFLADIVLFTLPTLGFIGLLFPMNIQYLYMNGSWAVFLAVMVSFGISLIAVTYLISFMFANANSAFKSIGLVYFLLGCILPVAIGFVSLLFDRHMQAYRFFKYLFAVIPFQNFGEGMVFIMMQNIYKEYYKNYPEYYERHMNELREAILCDSIMAIWLNIVLGILYFTIAVIIDTKK